MSDQTDVEALFDKEEADRAKIEKSKVWKPDAGDVLYGVLLDGRWVNTIHGDTRVLNVEDKDGEVWTVWASSWMLADELDKKAPKIGSTIGIKFVEKRPAKKEGGYPLNVYMLNVEVSDYDYWANNKRAFHQQGEDMNPAGGGGSGLAPDADTGLTAPF
jgi:hypothetical protein